MATRKKSPTKKRATRMKNWQLTVREVRVWSCLVPAGSAEAAKKRLHEATAVQAFPYISSTLEVEDAREVKH